MSSEATKQPRPDKRQVYVIWTNKGGVGKTTLSFHIATTFAILKQEEGWKVLVCDLCPQANISMTLLTPQKTKDRGPSAASGSGAAADSEANAEGADNVEKLCHERLRPDFEIYCTVAGYIQSFVSRKAAAKVPPIEFLIKPCQYNEAIPENMYLLCGDPALGVSCERLEQYRRSDPGGDGEEPWRESTLALREFVDAACDGVDRDANWLVIIDTNPALTTYTQLALVAADKIIMPVNADDFSKVAVKALFDLLYSTGEEEQRFSMIRKLTFAYKVKEYGVPLPRVRLVVNNRQTMYRTRASDAFSHMGNMIGGTLFDLFKKYPDRFVGSEEILTTLEGHTEDKQGTLFRAAYTADLKDFHSTAVLCTHVGLPLSVVATGNFKKLAAFRNVKKGIGKDCLKSVEELSTKMLKSPAEEPTVTGASQQSKVTSKVSGRQTSSVKGKPKTSDTNKKAGGQRKSAKISPTQSQGNPTLNQQTAALTTESAIQHTTVPGAPAATGATLHPMAPVQEPTQKGTSRQPQVSREKSRSQTDSAKTTDTEEKAGGQRFSVKSSSAQSDDNPNSNQQTAALAIENVLQHTTSSSTPAATEMAPAEEPTPIGASQKPRVTPKKSSRQTTLSWAAATSEATPLPIQGEMTISSTSDTRPSGIITSSQTQVPVVAKHESASLQQWPVRHVHQPTARIPTADEGTNKAFLISQKTMATQQSSATSTAAESAKGFEIPGQTSANPHRTTLLATSTASPHVSKYSQQALSPKQLTAPIYLSVQRPLLQTNGAAPVLPRTSFTRPHPEPSLLEEPPKRPRYDNQSSCG